MASYEINQTLEKLVGILEKHLAAKNEKAETKPTVIHIDGLYLYTYEEGSSLMSLLDFIRMFTDAVNPKLSKQEETPSLFDFCQMLTNAIKPNTSAKDKGGAS
jgi:hypothetical protein